MRKPLLFSLCLALLTLLLAPVQAQDVPVAQIRVASYVQDAEVVEVWIDGAFSGIQTLKFNEISGWVQIPAGVHGIEFRLQSTGQPLAGPVNVEFAPGSWSTLSLNGLVATGNIFINRVRENITAPLDPNIARVTVVNSVVRSVDLVLADGTVLLSGIEFGRSASVDLPAGTYSFRVVQTGTTSSLNASNLELRGGNYYLLSAVRTERGASLALERQSGEPLTGLIASSQASAAAGGPLPNFAPQQNQPQPQSQQQSQPAQQNQPTRIPPTPTPVPIPTLDPSREYDLVDIITAMPNLTRFLRALEVAGILDGLRRPGPYTVFAPTDEAFVRVSPEVVPNVGLLRQILRYHLVSDRVRSTDLFDQMTLLTVQGSTFRVAAGGGSYIINETARLVQTDFQATNGVLHMIDAVLLPPDIGEG